MRLEVHHGKSLLLDTRLTLDFSLPQVPIEVSALRDKVSSLEKEKDTLQRQLEDLQSNPSPVVSTIKQSTPSDLTEKPDEERLKWQVEMANIRREMEEKLAEERRGWESKRESLKKEVTRLGEELCGSKGTTHKQVEQLQAKLERSHQK